MKSIQSKIVILILIGIIVSATLIGGVGILSLQKVIDRDSDEILNLTCSKKAEELNNVLGKIEKSVKIMSAYAIDNLEGIEKLSREQEYLDEYTERLSILGDTIANGIDGAVGIYVRFSTDITSSKAGFWRILNEESGKFDEVEVTDLSKYSSDDERVEWYYLPAKSGEKIWMKPYYNDRGIYVISYVVPIYKNGVFVGVVGMDIEFEYIAKKCDDIKIYETGYAFITDEDYFIIHSKDSSDEDSIKEFSKSILSAKDGGGADNDKLYTYTFGGVEKQAAFRTLQNGMCLAVTAPVSEIKKNGNELITHVIMVGAVIICIFVFISWKIAKTIVEPIKELDRAAKEIANGNLDVAFECKSKDEIGTLSASLKETANQLKIRIDYINNLAFIDKLTGVKNNTAYMHDASLINEDLHNREVGFALFIIDINGLKSINDKHGHDYGNKLIIEVSNIIAEIFGYENVYRIGGDEFAVIMREFNSEKCGEYERKFEKLIDNSKSQFKLSAAIGSASYEESKDSSFESVFKTADERMYKMKTEMKSQGKTSCLVQA